MELPDVQNEKTKIPISLKKVGVIGVRAPTGCITFGNKPLAILPVFDIYIDLPAEQKGIHASRNYEVIPEILSTHVGEFYKLEDICAAIARELLASHEYASRAEVRARGDVVLEKSSPKTGKTSYESCKLMAAALGTRHGNGDIEVRKSVGVGVIGLTACPCGQEMLKEFTESKLAKYEQLPPKLIKQVLEDIPIATHMQRSHAQVFTEIRDDHDVDVARLARVVEKSMSASTYGLLKRSDEAEIILNAVSNTRFAEDCIRHMMKNFAETFRSLPDETVTTFRIRSKESIHKHDLMAERTITLGEIRRELNGNI